VRGSIVIPSRNGLEILKRCLPPLLSQAGGWEVIVSDDGSSDGTSVEGAARFPGVRFLPRTGEPGFCYAVNEGMASARGDVLLLLNNDVIPEPGALESLAGVLADAPGEVFAAVPHIERAGLGDEGGMVFAFRHGLAVTAPSGPGRIYPSGACTLFRRSGWRELGGLDERYAPIYWEDADLGARAARAGLGIIRAPCSRWVHEHAATMGSRLSVRRLRERNRFVFMQAHFGGAARRLSTLSWLPVHVISAVVRGRFEFPLGLLDFLLLAGRRA
jgi:O-antigen biosynthesis protein